MAALRIQTPAGPWELRRRNLASSPVHVGLDLVGFSSWMLPMGDHRCAGGTRGVGYVGSGRKSHPGAFLKNGVVRSLDDSGVRVCSSLPSEAVSFGSKMSSVNSMGFAQKKKGGKLWRRIQGGKKLVRHRAPKHGLGKDRHGHKSAVKDDDIDTVLSRISKESSIEECNSALICLEKLSDEKALNFFDWMKVNGKLKGNAHAYHLALQAIAWKEDWKLAELLLPEMVADSGCALDARAFNGLIYVCAKRRLDAWATKWFHMMLEREVQPNLSTIGMLMGLHQKTGKLSEAEFTFEKMRSCNIKCVNAYSAMITLYTRLGLFAKSEDTINLMNNDGLVPNMENWLVRLNVYCQQGKMEEAELVLQSMVDEGFTLNIVAYNTLITGYGKNSDMKKANKVFDSLGSAGLAPVETVTEPPKI